MTSQLRSYNIYLSFTIYCVLMCSIIYLQQTLLISDAVYHNSFANQLSYDRIEELMNSSKRWGWLVYALTPLLYAVKFFFIACCLLMGSVFFGIRLKFSEAFRIALFADCIFIVPIFLKISWFLFFRQDYTLLDIQNFYPLSLLNLFRIDSLDALWLYPLQTINLFECLYIFLLGFLVYKFGAKNYDSALKLVLASYLPALVVWMVIVMFCTVTLIPGS